MPAAATARPSSTVIVLDDSAGGPPLIFMGQRHRRSSFMASAWVFPGGAVDKGDDALGAAAGLAGGVALSRLGGHPSGLSEREALALHGAAMRELFEEAGVLLTADSGWSGSAEPHPDFHRGRLALCEAVLKGQKTLTEVAADLSWVLHGAGLYPWARWRTPTDERKRFDTHFFVARLPPGQRAAHTPGELVASRWISAPDALREHEAGDFWMAPPTCRVLEELAELGDVDAILDASPRRSMHAIMPVRESGDEIAVLLPGASGYPCPPGEEAPGLKRMVLTPARAWRSVPG